MRPGWTISGLPLAALALAGCSIDVNDGGHPRYIDYSQRGDLDYGIRRVVIEQPAQTRHESSHAMQALIDELRSAGCLTVSANSWRLIDERKGPDLRGARIVATCPEDAGMFQDRTARR